MSDFSTLKDQLADRLHEPNDATIIAEELLRALRHYKSERTPWNMKSGTLTTVADQNQYQRGVELPEDCLLIDYIAVEYSDTTRYEVERVSLEHLRDRDAGAILKGFPVCWAWGQESLWVYPASTGGRTLHYDYMQDSTRDEATGVEITASSTTETNEWFRRGAEILLTRAMLTYSMLRGWDDARAAAMRALNQDAEANLQKEMNLQRGYRLQVEGFWGE